ncbi:hypothetical protein M408DRAFT_24436 [Serendipita vermifera MAFF 305830]|uniref:Uncharacterized protein n=1 Tax=Serendipita vermifera MAFF 305830 TaxID=933852 RepID=A0A0C3ASG0_SERVB|nr:hypothetical protein M408DRAFT_24436 [Serendipita vermifera MAFF 305830]
MASSEKGMWYSKLFGADHMSKHPAGYYAGQPLGPGHAPPPVAGQPYDAYSTWSAAAAAAQQQFYAASAAAAVVSQPTPGINPYANYGYGPAATWAHHHHHRPPAPIPALGPQIPTYTPYQPQPQPYGPQSHPQPPTVYPARPPQPQPAGNQHPPAGPRSSQQPPLKRQRVQSTSSNGPSRFPPASTSSQASRPSAEPPASLPVTPSTSFNRGGRQGGGGMGNNSGGLRGRGHSMRSARGGRGPGMGNRPMNHGSRNASGGSAPRGPRRGGAFNSSVSTRVSRGQFEAPQSHNGWGNGPVGFTPSSSGMTSTDKEGKRTLTDFRIVGFGFVSEHTTWSWGTTRLVDDKTIFMPAEDGAVAIPPADEASSSSSPVKQEETETAPDQGSSSGAQEKGKKVPKETARIRIYFQPAPGSIPRGMGPPNQIMPPPNAVPSRASAKRKKSESEEDDGDRHNVKRHHGDTDESRPASLIVEMLDHSPNDTSGSNAPNDMQPVEPNSAEQRSDVSNDADWLDDALKDEKGDILEENSLSQVNGQEEHEAGELLDELDEEDEEATSLFGSGVHPSPPNGASELIVQAVDESVEEEGDNLASESQAEARPDESQRATSTPAIVGQSSGAGGPGGAGNKLSISFSTSRRRLVLEAEVIKYLKVFRAEGRIEFTATLENTSPAPGSETEESKLSIRGVCVRTSSLFFLPRASSLSP